MRGSTIGRSGAVRTCGPGPLAASVAFDILVAEANALADVLGGTLQDASHSTLTQQTVQHLREEVQAFARQVAAQQRHHH